MLNLVPFPRHNETRTCLNCGAVNEVEVCPMLGDATDKDFSFWCGQCTTSKPMPHIPRKATEADEKWFKSKPTEADAKI